MKKFCAVILLVVMMISLVACGSAKNEVKEEHKDILSKAVEELKNYWKQSYDEDVANGGETDRYFEIKNTRVITVGVNSVEDFVDVAYVIEFDIYSDYFATAPYYQNAQAHNNVVVSRNGEMEVASNVIKTYKAKMPNASLTNFIEAIDDYHDAYNWSGKLK